MKDVDVAIICTPNRFHALIDLKHEIFDQEGYIIVEGLGGRSGRSSYPLLKKIVNP